MATFQITFARSARKELQAPPLATARRILAKIEAFAANPRPAACRKLHGAARLWRLRIGEYRVVYKIDEANQIVDIVVVRHRGEAYR